MAPVVLKATLIGLYALGLVLPGCVAPLSWGTTGLNQVCDPMGWGTTGLADLCVVPGSADSGSEGIGEPGPRDDGAEAIGETGPRDDGAETIGETGEIQLSGNGSRGQLRALSCARTSIKDCVRHSSLLQSWN